MSVDNLTALAARDDLLFIVDHWTSLRARLRPGSGGALTGVVVSTSDEPSPIDLHVSDLMREIEDKIARFYGHILADETDWTPATSHMPGLLADVARRYGHFTADDQLALGFCDDAHEYREKVRKALERPAPPTYIGPCQGDNCGGELYVREGRDAGTCRECGQPFTLAEQRRWLDEQMEHRLMTLAEIPRALKILGIETKPGTVRKWAERERLVEATDGLYRLADAKELAERMSGGRVA